MRRHGTAFRGGHLFLAALLALPPCARTGLWLWKRGEESAVAGGSAARRGLDPASMRPLEPDFQDPEGRYRPVAADAIPLSDPSPARHVVWAVTRQGEPVAPEKGPSSYPGRGAVVPDTAAVARGALVGRVIGVRPEFSLARIQTLRDPRFRVRFSTEKGTGMLRPVGSDRDGNPLLEPMYLSPGCVLEEGMLVLTEGNDGVYPPGILIGKVEGVGGLGRGDGEAERLMVRAATRP